MLALIAYTALLQTPPVTAGRFDMGERLKQVDIAWLGTKDVQRRSAAVTSISAAVMGFFGGKSADTCKSLDLARAYLEGRITSPSEAITVRSANPFCGPSEEVTIDFSWAYIPAVDGPIEVSLGDQRAQISPGQPVSLTVPVSSVVPDLTRSNEIGALVPVRIDGKVRSVYVSVVRNAEKRITALKKAKNPLAADLGESLGVFIDQPSRMESEMPLIDHLFLAERLEEGKVKVEGLAEIPTAKQGTTVFRAAFPPRFIGKRNVNANVVIALHGAGGSENMFFESYGRGLAAKEALKRGWVFMSPRSSASAAQDCLNWLSSVRGLNVGKVFAIGHSIGGGIALGSGKLTPKPSAVALFAPAAGGAPKRDTMVPIFLALGKQEIGMLRNSVLALSRDMSSREDFKFKEYDPCEHLMIAADALPDAYTFFDRYAR